MRVTIVRQARDFLDLTFYYNFLKNITIALDGYSSTGKSTVAKMLAHELGYIYVDTGAMYRAVTLFALRRNLIGDDFLDKESVIESLPEIAITFKKNEAGDGRDVYLNGENVERQIRTLKVSGFVSQVAAIAEVREKMVEQQHEMRKNEGVVMDGRDIGTVVFPDAELKIFMTADAGERARRRYDELKERGDDIAYEAVLQNVQERDYLDTTREVSPLKKADDAIEIDSTHTNAEDVFHTILQLAKDRIFGRI